MSRVLVTRSSMPGFDEYMDEIKGLWDSHWLTNMGVKHRALQKKLQEYLCVERVELLTNGHMALELALCIDHTCNRKEWIKASVL